MRSLCICKTPSQNWESFLFEAGGSSLLEMAHVKAWLRPVANPVEGR